MYLALQVVTEQWAPPTTAKFIGRCLISMNSNDTCLLDILISRYDSNAENTVADCLGGLLRICWMSAYFTLTGKTWVMTSEWPGCWGTDTPNLGWHHAVVTHIANTVLYAPWICLCENKDRFSPKLKVVLSVLVTCHVALSIFVWNTSKVKCAYITHRGDDHLIRFTQSTI